MPTGARAFALSYLVWLLRSFGVILARFWAHMRVVSMQTRAKSFHEKAGPCQE